MNVWKAPLALLPGDWAACNVLVPSTGNYAFTVRVLSYSPIAQYFRIEIDGVDVTGTIGHSVQGVYTNVAKASVPLTAGPHIMKYYQVVTWGADSRVNWIEVDNNDPSTVDAGSDQEITLPTATVSLDATVTDNGSPDPPGVFTVAWTVVSGPIDRLVTFGDEHAVDTTATFTEAGLYVPGAYVLRLTADDSQAKGHDDVTIVVNEATGRVSLPGRLQAEDYSDQGEGVSYHDTTSGNAGGVYRSDGVDIEACGDTGGGYDVGWIVAGEWLAFDVAVAETRCYDIVARVSSATSSRQMHVEVDGADVTGAMTFNETGGWTNVTAQGIHLTAGKHVVKAVMDTSDFKLNYVDVLNETYEKYIVEDNTANADIVVSSSAHTSTLLAATELHDRIEQITGAALPIVTTQTGAQVHVYVGQSSYTDTLGISTSGLQYDAFKMVSGGNWLALIGPDTDYERIAPYTNSAEDQADWDEITGSTYLVPPIGDYYRVYNEDMDLWQADGCGSLQAVFEFLRDLGCRWYYPGDIGAVVPDLDDIGLPAVNRTVEPDYPLRNMLMWSNAFLYCDHDEVMWQLRLGTNAGQDSQGWIVHHGMIYVFGRDEMKAAHPTYYALIDGVRQTEAWYGQGFPCLSSQGLLAENVNFIQKAYDHYGEPAVGVGPTDGYQMCQCNLCVGKDTPERGVTGERSDYVMAYCNAVAAETYETHPGKKIGLGAYAYYLLPPLDIEQFSPNVVVALCFEEAGLGDAAAYQNCLDIADAWLALLPPSGQIIMRGYYLDGMPDRDPGNPEYFMRLVRNRLRLYNDGAALGACIEVGWDDRPWTAIATNHLNIYTTARLLWDSEQDLTAMLDEYYEKFYGPAAPQMKAFAEYCEANYVYFHTDPNVITTQRTLLNAAITAAAGSGVYASRVAVVDDFLTVAEEAE